MKLSIGVIAGVLALVSVRPAHASFFGDALNLKAPGSSTKDHAIYARRSDGTLWKKVIEPSMSNWLFVNGPSVGTSSGPQVGQLTINGQTGLDFIILRGGDGNIWASLNTGTSWFSYGVPPSGGTSTAPSVGSAINEFSIVVLDNFQIPWKKRVTNPSSSEPWQQCGSTPLFAAPAIEFSQGFTPTIMSLDSNRHTIYAPGSFGNFFQVWTWANGGVGISGLGGIEYPTTPGSGSMKFAVLGTDSFVYLDTSTNDGASFNGWAFLGGSPADSTPTIFRGFTNNDLVAVHRPDGNYWVFSALTGTWVSAGHP